MPYTTDNKEFTIDPGCPWYEAQQTYGAPNVNWCEPTQCALINEPANTWSNIPYILVGLILWKKLKKDPIKGFGPMVFFMGLFSFIYHATNNYMTQLLDFIGMFLMMSFLIAFAFNRVFGRFKLPQYTIFWFFMFLNTLIFLIYDIINAPVQQIMLMNTLVIVFLEIWAGWSYEILKHYKYFALAFLFLVVAQVFAIVDIQRIYCEPENIFLHGHVIWHLCGAFGMGFAGLHIKTMANLER